MQDNNLSILSLLQANISTLDLSFEVCKTMEITTKVMPTTKINLINLGLLTTARRINPFVPNAPVLYYLKEGFLPYGFLMF